MGFVFVSVSGMSYDSICRWRIHMKISEAKQEKKDNGLTKISNGFLTILDNMSNLIIGTVWQCLHLYLSQVLDLM